MTTTALLIPSRSIADAAPAAGVVASALRRLLWRATFGVTGGMTVDGPRPTGGCVVVANHSSHADAPALLAALPALSRPLVAAAQDYWFTDGWHRTVARGLMGAFPVRRNGGGTADLMGVCQALRHGRTVVLFPEGTRSRDGDIAEFRSGAFRLAAAAGVPVVPVSITGTRRLLPVKGLARPAGVAVRFGAPLDANAPEIASTARAQIARLHQVPAHRPDSMLRRRVAAFAGSGVGLLVAFLWGMSEAVFWPLLPELLLAVLIKASPRPGVRLAVASVAGSMVGVAASWTLARHGLPVLQPLTTPRMRAHVNDVLARQGVSGVLGQAFSGIPIKIYATGAGSLGLPLVPVLLAALTVRGLRIGAGAALLMALSHLTRRTAFLFPLYLALLLPGFALGLCLAVARWS